MLSKHNKPSTWIYHYELEGLVTALNNRIWQMREDGEYGAEFYVGAKIAATILLKHEYLETQEDFLRLFDKYVNEIGEEYGID